MMSNLKRYTSPLGFLRVSILGLIMLLFGQLHAGRHMDQQTHPTLHVVAPSGPQGEGPSGKLEEPHTLDPNGVEVPGPVHARIALNSSSPEQPKAIQDKETLADTSLALGIFSGLLLLSIPFTSVVGLLLAMVVGALAFWLGKRSLHRESRGLRRARTGMHLGLLFSGLGFVLFALVYLIVWITTLDLHWASGL